MEKMPYSLLSTMGVRAPQSSYPVLQTSRDPALPNSTSFHPQTDGLSERKNQWIEQYLRLVTSSDPEHWTEWLDIASAVHNNRKNATTGLSPNQILIGYKITLAPSEMMPSNNQTVEDRIKDMMQHRAQAIDAINKAAKGNGSIPKQYSIGDQVWLEGKHLK